MADNSEWAEHWRLCDELSVIDAALLIIGCDPSGKFSQIESLGIGERPTGYEAVKKALQNANNGGRLKAAIRFSAREYGYTDYVTDSYVYDGPQNFYGRTVKLQEGEKLDFDRTCVYRPFPDWTLTTVAVVDLQDWLVGRNIRPEFFFPNDRITPEYLDSTNSRYAPKLAAAVHAWQQVTDGQGSHPKSALNKWLRENAAQFGLVDKGGKVNETAIGECAKVANWKPEGGAPKTPGA